MLGIAIFEKVSFEQFQKDYIDCFGDNVNTFDKNYLLSIYDMIKLPKRATKHSAGYDFFTPISFTLNPKQNVKIPTGIKVKILEKGWFLSMHVRSSIGFKTGVSLSNTTGIIDADYYNNKSNEGHIFVKLSNTDKSFNMPITIYNGEAFCQGIFLPYGITINDTAYAIREGGIGSTNER